MRGPAPSIVCPRCELAAPPSDAIGPFTTCTRCGLSFDARAKERAIRPSRPPPAEPFEPAPPAPRPARAALSAYQVVAILVVVFVAGAVKWQYSWRYRASREQLAELERANRAVHERHQREIAKLDGVAASLKTGIEPCDALMQLLRTPPSCPSDDAAAELNRAIKTANDTILTAKSAAAMEGLCTTGLTDVTALAKRLDCH